MQPKFSRLEPKILRSEREISGYPLSAVKLNYKINVLQKKETYNPKPFTIKHLP